VSEERPLQPMFGPRPPGICGAPFLSAAHNPHGVFGQYQWHACELKMGHGGPHVCGMVSEEMYGVAPELG